MTRTLKKMPYAQAKVIENGREAMLISYTTVVIYINEEGWLTVTGLYSATTRKHIGAFMQEIGLDYQLAKQLYTDGYRPNIWTGELAEVA